MSYAAVQALIVESVRRWNAVGRRGHCRRAENPSVSDGLPAPLGGRDGLGRERLTMSALAALEQFARPVHRSAR